MSDLLLFNLACDRDDPLLGFVLTWVERLAARFDHIDVITMRAGRLDLPENVRVFSVGKERGYSEARRAAEFYRLLASRLTERRYAACFAHMMPLFAMLSAPLLIPANIPITLWYTHRSNTRTLRAATRVSHRIVTAAPNSFPFASSKLRVLGHGVDTGFFAPADPASDPVVVQVARLMPIKHQDTLIRALADVPNARAVFVGGVPPETSSEYADSLLTLAGDLGVADRVTFAGDQSREGVRRYLQYAAAAVNLSPVGLFDKAALESLACAVPTVVSNPDFASVLGEHAPHLCIESPDDSAVLAARLRDLLAMSPDARRAMGLQLRDNVIAQHSLDTLIDRLTRVLLTGESK